MIERTFLVIWLEPADIGGRGWVRRSEIFIPDDPDNYPGHFDAWIGRYGIKVLCEEILPHHRRNKSTCESE